MTTVLGVHVDAGIIVGLDPLLYDPLPMGISIEFKSGDVEATLERVGTSGNGQTGLASCARLPAAEAGLETLIAFRPDRLLDYLRLEREASSLALDPFLRMRAALAAAKRRPRRGRGTSSRSVPFAASRCWTSSRSANASIGRSRARRRAPSKEGLAQDPDVVEVEEIDADGPPDSSNLRRSGDVIASNARTARRMLTPMALVESKSRRPEHLKATREPVLQARPVRCPCSLPMARDGGPPRFVYRRSRDLARHSEFPDRLAVMHRIDAAWATSIIGALGVPARVVRVRGGCRRGTEAGRCTSPRRNEPAWGPHVQAGDRAARRKRCGHTNARAHP